MAQTNDVARQALIRALRAIILGAPTSEPRASNYDAHVAYAYGFDHARWEQAEIARKALKRAGVSFGRPRPQHDNVD